MKSSWVCFGLLAVTIGVGAAAGGCDDPAPPRPISQGGNGGEGGGGDGGDGPVFEGVISRSGASRFETDPQLSVNGDVVAVVWTGRVEPNEPGTIGYVISLDGGQTFGTPTTIAGDGMSYQSPDVEVDNAGNAYLTFLGHERGAAGAGIFYATSNGTETFSPPEAITDIETVGFYGPPRLALTNTNRVLIVYTETVGNGSLLRIARRDQTASEWSFDVDTGGGQNFVSPALCSAANTPMGRTYFVANVQGRTVLNRTEDNGETWMGIQASVDGDQIGGPSSCMGLGQHVWVSYGVRAASGLSAIKVAYSADGGETIMDVGVVSDPDLKPTFAIHAVTAQPPERGHLVYYNGVALGDDASSLYRVAFTPGSLMQEPPMLPSDPPNGLPGVLLYEPVSLQFQESDQRWLGSGVGVDFENGKLFVAFVDNSGIESHVAFKAVEL